jgi:hypothetical protein
VLAVTEDGVQEVLAVGGSGDLEGEAALVDGDGERE